MPPLNMHLRLVFNHRGPLATISGLFFSLLVCTGCSTFPAPSDSAENRTPPNKPIAVQPWSAGLQSWWRPERSGWKIWGEQNLQTGDLVFTRGNYYMLLGAINFTDLATKMCQADFSHVGIVVIEDNRPFVYDISDTGLEATPFEAYVTRQGYQTVAVRRPHESVYASLPKCVDYLRQQREKKVRFDRKFVLNNEQLYCTELIYEAYKDAGIILCQPIAVGDLPGKHVVQPAMMYMAKKYTGLRDDSTLICIGNESYGIYGSPYFSQLLEATPVESPPNLSTASK